jgi:hypothetical protein
VGILDSFEKGLERAVGGVFAKTFRSGLQPIELTSALRRELDTRAAIVTRDRVLAPNRFRIFLAPADYRRMSSMGPALIDELVDFVGKHAASQHYQFVGGIAVALAEDASLTEGILRVESENVKGSVDWVPVLDIEGARHPLAPGRTVVGRGSDADITIDDTGISRKHLEIAWDGSHAQARDLGSTNGSQLNGRPLTTAVLEPDSVITIGRTRIVFRVLPQAASLPNADAHRDDATRRNDISDLWADS